MSTFRLDKLSIDAVAYGSQGSAVLGIRDSGKTYTATLMAEHLFDAGIPFVTFDPVGIWRFLRVPGRGKGYPVVVAGGQDGDLPLTVTGAAEIVRAAMQNGVSLVIDLFDINLSKADWKRIVMSSVRVLLHENNRHGLRHIFIEEAAEFCPQRVGPDQGQVYAEIEKLARMGGNSRLGYTLINQRAEEVNKAVLELCDNLFLHRQKGRNSLTALSKWLDIGAVKDHKGIIDTLSTLPTGECWAWLAGSERPVHIKVPAKNSLHPDRRVMRGDASVKRKASVDVGQFVETMRGSLTKIEAEAKENDPKALRARIAELERQMRDAAAAASKLGQAPDPEAIHDAEVRGYARGVGVAIERFRAFSKETGRRLVTANTAAETLRAAMLDHNVFVDAFEDVAGDLESGPLPPHNVRPGAPERKAIPPRAKPSPGAGGNGTISPSLQKVLDAIAWWRKIGFESVERARASVVAGYSPKASTFGVYIAELVKLGLVEVSPGKVALTAAGFEQANAPTATTAAELREMARALLTAQEARVFDAVYDQYPKEIRRADVAEAVGLSPSASTCGVYIAGVAAYGIIENAGRGAVRAAEWLFP